MGYFKKKIILTVLGILILIALFSCVSYFTFAMSFGKKQQKTSAADLTISNLAELQAFANNVNNGNTYSGKTVVLGADIDCGDSGVGIGVNNSYFKGIFDGNGKTISNYKPNSSVESTIISSKYKAYGLFTKVDTSTQILNLRVANSGRTISGGDYKYVGGIVGNSEGATIQNCSVENFTITTTDKTDRIYVSGIFAAGYATVTNCYVQNLVINNGCGASAGIGCAANSHTTSFGTTSFAWKRSNSTLSSCVVNVTSLTYNLITDTAYDVSSGAYDYAHAITHCYNTANQTEGLDLTNTWYYHSGYNDDYPYLRKFMSWSTFYFDTDGDNNYETTRTVPADLETRTIEIINNDLRWNPLVVGFADSVQGASAPAGKIRVGWERIDDYHYKYDFRDEEYRLVFCTPICDENYIEATISINVSSQILNGPTATDSYEAEVTVKYEDSVSVSVEYSATETTVNYIIGNVTAVYTFSNIYCLESYGQLNDQEIVDGLTVPDVSDNHPFLIRPNIELKTYTPEYN